MAELIDRQALINAYCEDCDYLKIILCAHDICKAVELMKEAPAVDAVEVARCKDCKWRNTLGCPYENFDAAERDDGDYCSDGERGEENG